jgi:beta-glucosidase-like glycosyl hydrolase
MARSLLLALSATAAATTAAVQASSCPSPLQDTALSGLDIFYNVTFGGGESDCYGYCVSQPLCAAYTFYPGAIPGSTVSGRCFVKTGAGAQVNVAGAVSCASVPGRNASSCPLGLTPCPGSGACALFASTCSLATACPSGHVLCPDASCVAPGNGWAACPPSSLPAYLNTSLPLAVRVASIVSNLSLTEIGQQLVNPGYGAPPPGPPGIPRISIPPYNWLNEGLHGVARSGVATSFPQISVAGQTWNRTLFWHMGRTLGLEARVKHLMYRRMNSTTPDYTGVSYYAPNINLGRDPRWGRLQEVPTEDPAIMSAYGAAVVLGAQATSNATPPSWLVDPSFRGTRPALRLARQRKTLEATAASAADGSTSAIVACCKHAIAYSVEAVDGIDRAHFNAIVAGADLLDSYSPAFQSCFIEGGGASSMCSYNAVNGVPTCASAFLVNTTIRQRYGRGDATFVMSDYSAIADAYNAHHYCATNDECVATTIKIGVDQDGGGTDYENIPALVQEGLLTDADARQAMSRLFSARIALGILDPPQEQPWQDILDAASTLDSDFHRSLSLSGALQGIVLLSNPRNALPLKGTPRKVAVVGPNADVPDTLYGNYQGTPPYLITPRMGMVAALGNDPTRVYYAPGCTSGVTCTDTSGFAAAVQAASQSDADAVIVVLGIDQTQEAEGHDRTNITLPGQQIPLAQAVCAAAASRSAPCIVVYITGGPISDAWPLQNADAVVLLGYASQSAGTALASVLLGQTSPAGKLAVTWPASVNDLPPLGDMGMRPNATAGTPGRTYRFNAIAPLLSFGHGLTYTTWSYSSLKLPTSPVGACAGVPLSVTLTNTGSVTSEEVVQVYISYPQGAGSVPGASPVAIRTLVEFERVLVAAGTSLTLPFTLTPNALALVNASAAADFGQDFAMAGPEKQARALSGEAYGLTTDYHALANAQYGGQVPIGWDDMMFVPGGQTVSVWVGSGQPGTGAAGIAGSFTLSGAVGSATNLAVCDMTL